MATLPLVEVRNLNHRYGSEAKNTLDNINLNLQSGEIVFLMGPSGCGKTTLLTLIGGIRTVQDGELRVASHDLHGLKKHQLTELRQDIGFIFQAHNLFDALSARRNVRMALEMKMEETKASDMDRRADDILNRLGLGHRIHYKPQSLSGGQRQRVAIARALVNHPKIILADEPTAALDRDSSREVMELLKELVADQDNPCTVLLVTHDDDLCRFADRIINLSEGRIHSIIEVEETKLIIEFLLKCPFFRHETPAALTEISQKMVKERFTAGTTIIRQGEEGDTFYIVRDGEVQVTRDENGGVTSLATLTTGEFFGEIALITGEKRNATVRTETGVVVYSLNKGDFFAARAECPTFEEQLLHVFDRRR